MKGHHRHGQGRLSHRCQACELVWSDINNELGRTRLAPMTRNRIRQTKGWVWHDLPVRAKDARRQPANENINGVGGNIIDQITRTIPPRCLVSRASLATPALKLRSSTAPPCKLPEKTRYCLLRTRRSRGSRRKISHRAAQLQIKRARVGPAMFLLQALRLT